MNIANIFNIRPIVVKIVIIAARPIRARFLFATFDTIGVATCATARVELRRIAKNGDGQVAIGAADEELI